MTVPGLSFEIVDGGSEPYAAVPTLRFTLAVECTSPPFEIQSLLLTSQIRLSVARRVYTANEQLRLADLFGTPDRWGDSLKTMYWTHATSVIPSFEQRARFEMLVPVTYDFDVVTAKYFSGVEQGDIPLEFLFSGSVFYTNEDGQLQTARLSWESEARYRLPVGVWKSLMDHYYPNSAWIRLRRDVFDALYAVRAERSLRSWDDTVEALLPTAQSSAGRE